MGAITIVDHANGTGISATLTGLSGTGTLYVSSFRSDLATRSFAVARTFVANGTYTIAISNGAYFGIYTDGAGTNAPISFRASDGSTGVHERCLQAIREFILGLSLPVLSSDPAKHKTHKRPVRTRTEFGSPLVGCHYWKGDEIRRPVDNHRDEVIYPIEMVILDSNDGDNKSDGGWTRLREIIGRSFPRCPLSAVNEVHTVNVVPGPLYGTLDSAATVDVQLMTFRCVTEQLSLID